MNAYASETPRFAIALAAFALSALTIGMMVVAPAQFDDGFAPTDAVLAARPAAGPLEVAIVPAHIEVVAVRGASVAGTKDLTAVVTREPNVAWATGGPTQPNCKPEG
jgi:hypothetical protein